MDCEQALYFSLPLVSLRARVALRAKYRVHPAWLIKRLSCRLHISKVVAFSLLVVLTSIISLITIATVTIINIIISI